MNIDFPLHFDNRGRTACTGHARHVRNLIEQLLFTGPGERVNRPDFGSGAMQLVFTPNSPELAATLQFTIQASLQRWLGDLIEVHALEVDSQDSILRIELAYRLRDGDELHSETFERSAP